MVQDHVDIGTSLIESAAIVLMKSVSFLTCEFESETKGMPISDSKKWYITRVYFEQKPTNFIAVSMIAMILIWKTGKTNSDFDKSTGKTHAIDRSLVQVSDLSHSQVDLPVSLFA